MSNELLIAILAGLGGMLGWGLADFFAKKTIDRIGDVTTLAWGHVFGTSALVLMVGYKWLVQHQPLTWPQSNRVWLGLILFGIAQAAVYLFVYKGFGKGQLAVLNPVFASFSGLTAILSVIFFREALTAKSAGALIILFVGIIFISADFGAWRARRFDFSHLPGFREVALATIMAALWTLFWDRFIGGQDWLSYTALMYVFMTLTIWLVARVSRVQISFTNQTVWKFLVLIGLCETGAYLAISLGYSRTSLTSVVALLSGAFSLPTIILARAFLKEKITRWQTWGGIVIILGIILVALT